MDRSYFWDFLSSIGTCLEMVLGLVPGVRQWEQDTRGQVTVCPRADTLTFRPFLFTA